MIRTQMDLWDPYPDPEKTKTVSKKKTFMFEELSRQLEASPGTLKSDMESQNSFYLFEST
jgi:hypothetical protein